MYRVSHSAASGHKSFHGSSQHFLQQVGLLQFRFCLFCFCGHRMPLSRVESIPTKIFVPGCNIGTFFVVVCFFLSFVAFLPILKLFCCSGFSHLEQPYVLDDLLWMKWMRCYAEYPDAENADGLDSKIGWDSSGLVLIALTAIFITDPNE